MKTHLVRTGLVFMPADNRDNEILCQFAEGEVVQVDIRKARNYEFHKKYFALIKVGFELQNMFDSFEWWRYWITIKAGYFESCQSPNGEWMFRPKSIAFDKLDQIEFQDLYKAVSAAIIKECKVSQEALEENLELFF